MDPILPNKLLSITLSNDRGVVELQRCDDKSFRDACQIGIPIGLMGERLFDMLSRRMGLAEIYAALTMLTGPSGALNDDWKGAFAFPFKVTVRRGDHEFRYFLLLMNIRSMVEPHLYRAHRPGESHRRDVYHAPFDEELSIDDIAHMIDFIHGFLEGFLETAPRWTTPFVKEVQSNLILYGYDPDKGAFFEHEFESQEAYQAELDRLRTSFANVKPVASERGIERGERALLLKQLRTKFGQLPNPTVDQVHSATNQQIDTWAQRILTAPTLAEVFAAP